ncbi:MAG: hypothetical protein D5R98_00230 [Desulfonatronovibrio sp. MSAO_Bac4]|nr:MAG: hypothetical protein D5R98_00230 [Desulfonatronovibrio sp. MSAO_Bac4]
MENIYPKKGRRFALFSHSMTRILLVSSVLFLIFCYTIFSLPKKKIRVMFSDLTIIRASQCFLKS